VFLHGWPEDWSAWADVLGLAASDYRVHAIDLPGIGMSLEPRPRGDKKHLADRVHELIKALDLKDVTLVGQDVGGMIAYAYMREFTDLSRAVVMDTVVPGIAPWDKVIANPYIWHFAFHTIPQLPETLVTGREAEYFNYFYDTIAADSSKITADSRIRYVAAYKAATALQQGFEFYRSFHQDVQDNTASQANPVDTPLLYLRGDREGGVIDEYVAGFRTAGVTNVTCGLIANSGHFAPEEAPAGVWEAIRTFIRATPSK
jgi:pimeloyl-ACP methyl ester carboxylesterase